MSIVSFRTKVINVDPHFPETWLFYLSFFLAVLDFQGWVARKVDNTILCGLFCLKYFSRRAMEDKLFLREET